jgi:hypothetical protein
MIEEFKKERILEAAKNWFREIIVPNHIKNTLKLSNPKEFQINPFLVKYLARYLTGKGDAQSIAKALILPRALQTSITTSFGTNAQKFVSELRSSIGGSTTTGIDIEFIDQIDGKRKYCQLKLGPNTINKDDVETINQHFGAVKRLSKQNHIPLEINQLIVGVLYGEPSDLSTHYINIEKKHFYPVYVGEEFWKRLTGSDQFYNDLSTAISEVALEFDSSHLLDETISKLAQSDEIKNLAD